MLDARASRVVLRLELQRPFQQGACMFERHIARGLSGGDPWLSCRRCRDFLSESSSFAAVSDGPPAKPDCPKSSRRWSATAPGRRIRPVDPPPGGRSRSPSASSLGFGCLPKFRVAASGQAAALPRVSLVGFVAPISPDVFTRGIYGRSIRAYMDVEGCNRLLVCAPCACVKKTNFFCRAKF